MNCGFLIVASRDRAFLGAARRCALSILDEWPEASICLATHEEWRDEAETLTLASPNVQIMAPVPDHRRAKLWALSRSPFDRTLYVDADMYCVSEEVGTVFSVAPDAPLLMTENRPYNSAVVYFTATEELHHERGKKIHEAGQAERLRWHCGFLRYDLPRTAQLMRDWLAMLMRNHRDGAPGLAPKSVTWWDTFALWRCLHQNTYDFDVTRFPHDGRWQYIDGYRVEELEGGEPIFTHHTIPQSARVGARGDGDMEKLR